MFVTRVVATFYFVFSFAAFGDDLLETARLMMQGATHRLSVAKRETLWNANWNDPQLQSLRQQLVVYYRGIINKRPSDRERLFVAREQAFAARFLAAAGELTPDDGAYVTQLIATPHFRSSWKRNHRTTDVLGESYRELLLDSLALSGFTNSELLQTLAKLYLVKSDNPLGHKAAKMLVARAAASEDYRRQIESLIRVEDLTTKLSFLHEKLSTEIVRLSEAAKEPGAKPSIPDLINRRKNEMSELQKTINTANRIFPKSDCAFEGLL